MVKGILLNALLKRLVQHMALQHLGCFVHLMVFLPPNRCGFEKMVFIVFAVGPQGLVAIVVKSVCIRGPGELQTLPWMLQFQCFKFQWLLVGTTMAKRQQNLLISQLFCPVIWL